MTKEIDPLYRALDTLKFAIDSSCMILNSPNISEAGINAANLTIMDSNRKLRDIITTLEYEQKEV